MTIRGTKKQSRLTSLVQPRPGRDLAVAPSNRVIRYIVKRQFLKDAKGRPWMMVAENTDAHRFRILLCRCHEQSREE